MIHVCSTCGLALPLVAGMPFTCSCGTRTVLLTKAIDTRPAFGRVVLIDGDRYVMTCRRCVRDGGRHVAVYMRFYDRALPHWREMMERECDEASRVLDEACPHDGVPT